ncbi:hypothetical protein D3C75_1335450 [compost metagenome]
MFDEDGAFAVNKIPHPLALDLQILDRVRAGHPYRQRNQSQSPLGFCIEGDISGNAADSDARYVFE